MLIPRLCVVGLLVCYTVATVEYAAVWQNRFALWTYAVQHAPLKPRPWIQLSIELMQRRQFMEAQAVLDRIEVLAADPRVPSFDHAEARAAVQANRLTLARISNAGDPFRR